MSTTIIEVLDIFLGVPTTAFESEIRYVLGIVIIIFALIVVLDLIHGAVHK